MIAWEKISADAGFRTTKEMLEKLYLLPPHGEGRSIQKLSEKFGCSIHAIREIMLKNHIAIRHRGGAQPKDHSLEKIDEKTFQEKGARAIANEFGLDVTTVYKHFRRRGIRPKNETTEDPTMPAEESTASGPTAAPTK